MSLKVISRNRFLAKMPILALTLLILVGVIPLQHVHGASMSLTFSPSAAAFGDYVQASGFTFTGNGEVRIYLEDLFVASTVSDGAGNYGVEFLVPAVPSSTYFMIVVDTVSGMSAYALLTVEPKVSVTPTSGSFGDYIAVKGYGFAGYNQMTLWLDGAQVSPVSSLYTDPLGSFEASFAVPAMPNGTYLFEAEDESGNSAASSITISPKLTTAPVSAPCGTFVFAEGYGFGPDADLTIMFGDINVTPNSYAVVMSDGSFSVPFFVPGVPNGTYAVSASDDLGNVATAPFVVPSPIMMLSPDTISGSTVVTVEGSGFSPAIPVILYFADTLVGGSVYPILSPESVSASLLAPAVGNGNTIPDEHGLFEYSFVVPANAPGTYSVAAYQVDYSVPSGLSKVASATLTILDGTPLDIEATVGSVHFRGELCEFYMKTSFEGGLVNVHFSQAMIYWSNGTYSQSLLSNIRHVSTGFYRVPFALAADAPTGTYALLVRASYLTSLVDSEGTGSASFLISPTLTSQAAQILSIEDDIATIVVPDLNAIAANLTSIDARLVAVEGQVATIQSDLGTLQTNVETINATLVSIQGKTATVQSDLGALETEASAINALVVDVTGTQATIQSDLGTLTTDMNDIHARVTSIDSGVATVESDLGTVKVSIADSGSQMNATSVFALVAALCSIAAASLMIFARRTPKTPPASTMSMPSEQPPDQSAKNLTPQKEETQKPGTSVESMPQTEGSGTEKQETPVQAQTDEHPEKPEEEVPQTAVDTPPSSPNPADQTNPSEPSPQPEQKPQDPPQQQPEPQTELVVLQLEEQPPQQN